MNDLQLLKKESDEFGQMIAKVKSMVGEPYSDNPWLEQAEKTHAAGKERLRKAGISVEHGEK